MISTLKWVVGIVIAGIAALGISWVIYAPDKALRGVWQTDGYGLILDVSATRIKAYEASDVHCRHDQTIPTHTWLINFLEGVTLAHEGDQLVLNVAGTLNPIRANRIAAVPDLCDVAVANTPTMVFDIIWEVMNTHYAHFDTHGVDWAARKALRPAPDASDEVLYTTLQDLLTGLDDGHTFLATERGVWSPSIPPAWHDVRHLVRDTTLAAIPETAKCSGG